MYSVMSQPCIAALGKIESVKLEPTDRQYIFVLLAPVTIDDELADPANDPERVRQIRRTFPVSGLYTNSESPALIWKYYGKKYLPYSIETSRDGVYAVLFGQFLGSSNPDSSDVIAEFLVNGKPVGCASYGDISSDSYVNFRCLFMGVDCVYGLKGLINERNKTFTVSTNLREEITYDLRTGRIISYSDPFRDVMLTVCAIVACAVVGLLLQFIRSRGLQSRCVES